MHIEKLGRRLKNSRLRNNLSLEKVAMITRISIENLEKFEDDTLTPNIEDLATLIELYKTDANWILKTNEYQKREKYKMFAVASLSIVLYTAVSCILATLAVLF